MLPYWNETATAEHRFLSYTVGDLGWYAHFHEAFEICFVNEGSINIMIDGVRYELERGDSVIIFPRQLHSYDTPSHSDMNIITFVPDMVESFSSEYADMIPENNRLYDIEKYVPLFFPDNIYRQKGLLYSILGDMTERTSFKEAVSAGETALVKKVLRYIDKNYADRCSLRMAADTLSYGYTYLSRIFARFMGMSYTEYLNRYRINKAVYLLTTKKNISVQRVAELCGYDRLCSFNRNFREFAGCTPREIIKKKHGE